MVPMVMTAADKCPDLSGRYMIQGEDGQVHIIIEQRGCGTITIARKTGYLGTVTSERHDLRLDGVLQRDTGWFGGSDKQVTSARFVPGGLEIVARPASAGKRTELFWKELYELLPNGDLSIRDFDKRTQSYDSGIVAHREGR